MNKFCVPSGIIKNIEMNSQKNGCLILLIILLSFEYSNSQVIGALQKGITNYQIEQLILDTRTKVNSILKKEVYLPGIAVAIVSRDKILMAEGFGYRDKLRTARVDTNTIFGILSVSKPVTVTGLMIAEQQGLLNFDVPIKNYLPGFTIQSRFAGDPMSEITIRHLISMTSGLTHDAPVGNNADPYSPSYESHIQSISQTWLRFRTGEHAEYSNLGIELAAYCLEQVIHKPFTEYILLKIVEFVTGKKNEGPSDWLNRHVTAVSVGPRFLPDNLEGNYNGTNDDMKFLIKDSVFGYVSGTSFVPLKPVTPVEFVSGVYLYRFNVDVNGKAVSVTRPYDGMQWNISESKYDQKGPEKDSWRQYEGTYIRKRFGRAERFYIVKMNNGRLHFIGDGQDCVLNEFKPGMFYIPNGEVVNFGSKPSTYRNIKLYKTSSY